jgi:hypothetical protein
VLFYVNAFSQGDILGRNEINEFLKKLKIERTSLRSTRRARTWTSFAAS